MMFIKHHPLLFMAGRRPKICSIYLIENVKKGKVYIGSSVDTAMRWNAHLAALLLNKHSNQNLQGDWNMSGGRNFTFRLLKVFPLPLPSAAQLRTEEQKILDAFPLAKLYNLVRAVKRKTKAGGKR